MTTCRTIITRAYRMAGNLRDANAPLDASDAAVGLEELEGLLMALPGSTHWTDVEVTDDYEAGENERIYNTAESSVEITLPVAVTSERRVLFCCNQYELVCEGYDDRYPNDGARVQVVGATPVTFRFCADQGEWLQTSGLALGDTVPLNADLHAALTAMLATALAALEGAEPPAVTFQAALTGQAKMRARFGKRPIIGADLAILSRRSRTTEAP